MSRQYVKTNEKPYRVILPSRRNGRAVEGGGLENQIGNGSFFPLNRLAVRCYLVLPAVRAVLWQELWQNFPVPQPTSPMDHGIQSVG